MSEKLDFEFSTTKGSKVKISYTPDASVRVSDKKAFEGHLKKVAESLEIHEEVKKEVKPKPKTLEVVAKEENNG